VMQRALNEQTLIAAELRTRAAELAEAGCPEQVPTREDASLVFFHPRGVTGPRYRLTRTEQGFCTPEGPVSDATVTELLASEPLRFSTSALLRPLVQDTLLPTCAYLGGPAEVSYFAQLPPLYARFGLPMPMIAPRARLRVVDTATQSLLRKLNLQPADLDAPRQSLLARVVGEVDPALRAPALRARLLAPLQAELAALEARALPAATAALHKTRQTCERSITKLSEQLERAALERDAVACGRLDRLLAALRPDGLPQERAYGFLALAARSGPRALTAAILQGANTLDPSVKDVYP
jgi:bacillithiol synthase